MFEWICPICNSINKGETPTHDVCAGCDWEDDPIQRKDPTYWGGANDLCLNDYKAAWNKKCKEAREKNKQHVAAAV
ncbi:MAG: hypothetical protein FWE11_05695 [Defluviitaleaceae bacterium]|nr:hypothetical protein [Defluviitaleaceae bacterium]